MTDQTPTPPPLDLAALRETFERAASSKYAGVIEPTVMLSLIARAEAAEAKVAAVEALFGEYRNSGSLSKAAVRAALYGGA